ncbi:hypothetical protein HDU91_003535, partial [Kappamyces sp. JEL0680]
YEYLLALNVKMEAKWMILASSHSAGARSRAVSSDSDSNGVDDGHELLGQHSAPVRPAFQSTRTVRIARSILRMTTVGLAYILMLLVMSFNVGLFLSVLGGLGIGTFVWGDAIAQKSSLLEKEH